MGSLFLGDVRKSVTFESGGPGGFGNSAVDRAGGQHIADASAQLSTQVKRRENAAEHRQVRSWSLDRNLATFQRGGNGIMRQAQQ